MDLQWKRDMRQGVVTCLCEVGLGCGAFPWIGGIVVFTENVQLIYMAVPGDNDTLSVIVCWRNLTVCRH